jgi:hypothetical protein
MTVAFKIIDETPMVAAPAVQLRAVGAMMLMVTAQLCSMLCLLRLCQCRQSVKATNFQVHTQPHHEALQAHCDADVGGVRCLLGR